MEALPDFPHITEEQFLDIITRLHALCTKLTAEELQGWESSLVQFPNLSPFLRIRNFLPSASPFQWHNLATVPQAREDLEAEDGGIEELIEIDEEAIDRSQSAGGEGLIRATYDITYSPTYNVPVLHLSVQDASGSVIMDLDHIQKLFKGLRSEMMQHVGIVGGLSPTYHPELGTPIFFIHPCLTADAMSSLGMGENRSDYLIAWLGVVGGVVGLYVPPAVALEATKCHS
ncbi:hypothetical protein BT63DRAFT_430659 [Microthyrium microscopicum]|uniref:Ubiquitin-like-conjugating enzyme ATG10 n=1 Tax=Microthyrium microscopicum TaxID=703497 RepID=A0A6A6TSP7_9PEZI|nr:hypothetical protein BT63DRAFT_430659 [Microthyrium microscopicum]